MDLPDQPDLLCLGAPLGTGHVHDLFDELVQQPGLGGVGGVVVDLLAVAAGGQQAAVPEDAEVVGDGRAGHIHHGGDVHHALLAVAQQPENADAVGVAQLPENIGKLLKGVLFFQHLADDLRVGRFFAVVMRQGRVFHTMTSVSPEKQWFSPGRQGVPPDR